MSAMSAIGRSRQDSVDGDVSTWAGGRQRASIADGERGQSAIGLRLLTLSTVETLRSWKGIPVQFRDTRGQRLFGVYFDVDVKERREPDLYDADITLRTLSIVEGV